MAEPAALVRRPGVGILGQSVAVRYNCFEITSLLDMGIRHYDITIIPDVPPALNRMIFRQLIDTYGSTDFDDAQPAYNDRRNMFSSKVFQFDKRTIDISLQMILASDVRPGSRRLAPIFKVKL
ncbi:hypothetical protein BGZ58_009774 [Dissophora ornata]|nr:hypothetical protein BGZ58_009774 [Dissophora ornata]